MKHIDFAGIFMWLAIASIVYSISSCLSKNKEAYYEYKKAEALANELPAKE